MVPASATPFITGPHSKRTHTTGTISCRSKSMSCAPCAPGHRTRVDRMGFAVIRRETSGKKGGRPPEVISAVEITPRRRGGTVQLTAMARPCPPPANRRRPHPAHQSDQRLVRARRPVPRARSSSSSPARSLIGMADARLSARSRACRSQRAGVVVKAAVVQ
jgi:hypothetical protein